MRPAEIRKLIVFVAGAASVLVSQGVIAGTAAHWVAVVLLVLTGAGLWRVPNASPPQS